MLFALAAAALARTENAMLGDALFWLLVAPALVLALPFIPLLWSLHLMEAPGWFAWPKPLGFALVYAVWVIAFFAASFVFRKRQ